MLKLFGTSKQFHTNTNTPRDVNNTSHSCHYHHGHCCHTDRFANRKQIQTNAFSHTHRTVTYGPRSFAVSGPTRQTDMLTGNC